MTTPQDHPPVPPQPPFVAPQQPPQYAGAPVHAPQHPAPEHPAAHVVVNPAIVDAVPRLRRIAIWTAIGALIIAALICVIWVLVGQSSDIAARAFLTVLLLAGFAGISILETNLAPRREPWFSFVSMIVWVVTLLIGAVMIWMPAPPYDDFGAYVVARFFKFLLIVLILQLGVLHLRLYSRVWLRHRTRFTDVVAISTIALVGLLAVMLVFPLMAGEWLSFHDLYWRLAVAIAILAAVGTALLPLMNALFAPRVPRQHLPAQPVYAPQPPVAPHVAAAPPGWPVYAGTQMPLPMLPDGSPDWHAYYTGQPTPGAVAVAHFPPQQQTHEYGAPPQQYPVQPQPPQPQPQQYPVPPQQPPVVMAQPPAPQPPVPAPPAPQQHPEPPQHPVVPQGPVPPQPPAPRQPPVPPGS